MQQEPCSKPSQKLQLTAQAARAASQHLPPDIHCHGRILDGEWLLLSCSPLATTSA